MDFSSRLWMWNIRDSFTKTISTLLSSGPSQISTRRRNRTRPSHRQTHRTITWRKRISKKQSKQRQHLHHRPPRPISLIKKPSSNTPNKASDPPHKRSKHPPSQAKRVISKKQNIKWRQVVIFFDVDSLEPESEAKGVESS